MRNLFTIRSRGKKLELGKRTCIMGVVNITPDSFYDGGRHYAPEEAANHGLQLLSEGADIVDLGGQSTRPGSQPVGAEEELRRILPVLRSLRSQTDAWISIDTYRSEVAQVCLAEGADLLNDVSSFRMDPKMTAIVSQHDVPVVCMHFLESLHPMPSNPHYKDLFGEILDFFHETLRMAQTADIAHERIIVDPGIGFGKNLDHNLKLIRGLSFLQPLGCPVLAGPSRKSFIGKITGLPAEQRLEGTAAAAAICVQQGAHILRAHDAGFMRRFCDVLDELV
jgi:dihydropteroate synthase